MTTSREEPAPVPLLNVRTWVGVWVTLVPLLVWSSVSITKLTHAAGVAWMIAWIPAMATDGAMIAATQVAVNHLLEPAIRRWAGSIAVVGITGSILAAGAEHYLTARQVAPPAELAAVIGAIPSLMGALLVHVIVLIGTQRRRERTELDQAHAGLSAAAVVRAATERELAEASQFQQAAHAEAARVQQAVHAEQEAAATRSRQAVQHELQQAAELREELSRTRGEIETETEALDQARREHERRRSQARRARRDPTTPRPEPATERPDTTDPGPVSRTQRRAWVRQEITAGRRPTGADVDRRFGPPRTGAAILHEVDAEIDGELRAVAGSPQDATSARPVVDMPSAREERGAPLAPPV